MITVEAIAVEAIISCVDPGGGQSTTAVEVITVEAITVEVIAVEAIAVETIAVEMINTELHYGYS